MTRHHSRLPFLRSLVALAALVPALGGCGTSAKATGSSAGTGGGSTSGGPAGSGGSTATTGGTTTGSGGATTGSTTSSGNTTSSSTSSSGTTTTGKIELAPYFETWSWGDGSYPFTGLVDLKAKSGVSGVTLAFVLSNGGCTTTQDIEQNQADVDAFKASGGFVKASFGGADGTYLDVACSSAGAFAAALESFVETTGITDLDFDVEQAPVMTTAANARRGQGLAQAQAQKGIKVSFTLPVDTSGLPADALDVVKQAVKAGVTISHVNIMVMDYGQGQTGSMSGYAKQALAATQAQLLGAIPGLDGAGAWAMLGATPMIGQNDTPGEVFTLADAQSLLAYAQQQQIGLLSFWSIHRDRPGTDYNTSSTVNTANFQFADVFKVVQ
jgi:chitinase